MIISALVKVSAPQRPEATISHAIGRQFENFLCSIMVYHPQWFRCLFTHISGKSFRSRTSRDPWSSSKRPGEIVILSHLQHTSITVVTLLAAISTCINTTGSVPCKFLDFSNVPEWCSHYNCTDSICLVVFVNTLDRQNTRVLFWCKLSALLFLVPVHDPSNKRRYEPSVCICTPNSLEHTIEKSKQSR